MYSCPVDGEAALKELNGKLLTTMAPVMYHTWFSILEYSEKSINPHASKFLENWMVSM